MSHEAINWALACTVGDSNRKLVLYGLANHAHKNGRNAYCGKPTLAEYAEISERTVARVLRRLQAGGFIRLGDQRIVEHIRADRRPMVYDLAMSEAVQLEWAAAFARGDSVSSGEDLDPSERGDTRGDDLSPRDDTHGVTNPASRGDKALSPEPREPKTPLAPAQRGNCRRHPDRPGDNCRSCGTTQRQLDAAARSAAVTSKRVADQAAAVEARQLREQTAGVVEDPETRAVIDQARQQIRSNRRKAS